MILETKMNFLRKENISGTKEDGKEYNFDLYFFLDNEQTEIVVNPPYNCEDEVLLTALSKLKPLSEVKATLSLKTIRNKMNVSLIEIK